MPIELRRLVARHVADFNANRLKKIGELDVAKLLRRKNPYLFAARQTTTAESLADELVRASLSSSEETLFGGTLEAIAIDVCAEAFGGQKSAAEGIDLEFTRDDVRYLVAIKSGTSWGNSSQVARLRGNFNTAKRVIRQTDREVRIEAVNGCCYGKVDNDRGDYRKVAGAAFWELISGEPDLYARLIEALEDAATNGFESELADATEMIATELAEHWTVDGTRINWQQIVQLNSGNL